MLKEIFLDRHILGEPIEENLCLVSACNPYKLRKNEMNQLSTGLKFREKDIAMSKLVYCVLPLPESMIPFIWDYKSLH